MRQCKLIGYDGEWDDVTNTVRYRRAWASTRANFLAQNTGRFNAPLRRVAKKMRARDVVIGGGGAASAFKIVAGNGCGLKRAKPKTWEV